MNFLYMIGFGIVAALFAAKQAGASVRSSAPSESLPEPAGGAQGGSDWYYQDDNQYGFYDSSDLLTVTEPFAPVVMMDPQYWGGSEGMTFETISSAPTWEYPPEAAPYIPLIEASEQQYGLPPRLLGRLLWQESRFNPKAYNVNSGAKGIAQFLPAAAGDMGVLDPYDPSQAIPGAAKYLAWLRSQVSNWRDALAAYNWGIGNLDLYLRGVPLPNGKARVMPEETRKYLAIADDVGVA